MSGVIAGAIQFNEVFQYDEFNETFDISGIDLDGKRLLCQVRETPETDVVLEFNEDDQSLVKGQTDSLLVTEVTLYKRSDEMIPPPLFEFEAKSVAYHLSIIMYTDDGDVEDVTTIVTGTMEIIHPITKL